MFNKDFFPTPEDVISRMLFNEDIQGKVILEPSAGKGNIVDYLQKNGAKEVIACELNNDLAKIVQSKCRLLASDFLMVESSEVSHIDLIVMNPPFSNDEKHILHAWEIAPAGCTVISLCNANTISNTYSNKREQIKELINLYGKTEDFDSCFEDAERKTDVDIACIWLYKPKTGEDEFTGYFSLEEEVEEQGDGLVKYNYIRDLVGRYTDAVRLFDSVMEVSNRVNSITAPISQYGIKFGAYRSGERNYNSDKGITRDEYKKELQKQCWMKIFNDMKMDKYVTKGVKETINKFVEQQVHVPFTMKNIYKMLELIVGTHGSRMNKVLIEAFENICSYSWSENCTGGEHWKTNSDYMVNKRFIVPYICDYDARWATDYVKVGYSSYDKIGDIVKGLCFLTGMNYNDTTSLESFVRNLKMQWGQWYEWGFFRIRGYKKGTMHFEFTDEKVWQQFNMRVAEIKGWRLPTTSNNTKKARKKGTGVELY